MSIERFDVVVAGSGAGGAAVAGRMAEGGARVLVLERGGFARTHADAMEAVCRYYVEAGFSAALGNALVPIPTGNAVGGTTTINSGTCLRTPQELLSRWESSVDGFDAGVFGGYLDAAWTALKVKRAPENTMCRSSRLILDGLKRLDMAPGERLTRCEDGCVGSGRCCFVCPKGAKMTSYKAFLEAATAGGNLELRANTELVSIERPLRAGGAVGLKARDLQDGAAQRIECGALVLSTGTLITPHFVRAAGLGPAAARAGDGRSLHPAAQGFAHFKEPVRGWEGVPQGAGFVDPEDPAIRCEGVYTPPEMAALTMPLEGRRLKWWMDRYHHVATFGYMIQDEGRGRVRYPAGPGRPLIRYEMTRADLRRMLRGMGLVARVFFAGGAEKVVLPLNRPGNELEKADSDTLDLRDARAAQLQTMAFHPLGTCGMGRVVDGNLRACPGVYVCDGSVVPESLGVNPQMTIYAFGLRLAEHLLGSVIKRKAAAA